VHCIGGPPLFHNHKVLQMVSCTNSRIVDCHVHGDDTGKPFSELGAYWGIYFHACTDSTLEDTFVTRVGRAIWFSWGNRCVVNNCVIDTIGFDGIFVQHGQHIKVTNNYLTNFYRHGTVHADYIQFDAGSSSSRGHVLIEGNVCLAGIGNGEVQGIFLKNRDASSPWHDVVIRNNFIADTGINGITPGDGNNITIENNTVLNDPHARQSSTRPRIGSHGTNVVCRNNVGHGFFGNGLSGNVVVSTADYDALFEGPLNERPIYLSGWRPKASATHLVGKGYDFGTVEPDPDDDDDDDVDPDPDPDPDPDDNDDDDTDPNVIEWNGQKWRVMTLNFLTPITD
jgi:hypothetical protein